MTHRKTTKKVPPHIARWIDLTEMVKDYKEMFETINRTCHPSEHVPLTPEHYMYYAGQISNLNPTWPGAKCLVLAKAICNA